MGADGDPTVAAATRVEFEHEITGLSAAIAEFDHKTLAPTVLRRR